LGGDSLAQRVEETHLPVQPFAEHVDLAATG
jgi:hypothetical protein